MHLRLIGSLLFSLTLTTGCSMTHGDPRNPTKNPHPVKRYEVIATVDAPGSWDSVTGVVFFGVINVDCVPQGALTGGRNVPNIDYDFEMTRVDEKTWRGYFYRDMLQNEDYFGLGLCHWDATGLGSKFTVHGANFTPSEGLKEALKARQYTEYFKKSDFLNHSLTDVGYGTTTTDPEVAKHPDAFFPIMVTVKEVTL